MSTLPSKITPDAISEALLEIRFDHAVLPEVALGKLAGSDAWGPMEMARMPGEVPEQLKAIEPNLRYAPSIELRSSDAGEVVRVGSNSISHHIVGNYIGWNAFQPKLMNTAQTLFTKVPGAKVTRLGLRYINALTPEQHHISSVYDLAIGLEVGGDRPPEKVQLAFEDQTDDLAILVRIVSALYVDGAPAATAAIVDIDVFSLIAAEQSSVHFIEQWLERAHDAEKRAFFRLLKGETLSRLKGE